LQMVARRVTVAEWGCAVWRIGSELCGHAPGTDAVGAECRCNGVGYGVNFRRE
jgi:hypothetical protein